jgi:hypothetical protein
MKRRLQIQKVTHPPLKRFLHLYLGKYVWEYEFKGDKMQDPKQNPIDPMWLTMDNADAVHIFETKFRNQATMFKHNYNHIQNNVRSTPPSCL